MHFPYDGKGVAMQNLRQDIAYALRQMRHSPVFTVTAMLTLALGIGATTAIFSLIHTVMLKSLPVVDPATLYRVGGGNDCCVEGSPQDEWGMFSYRFYLQMKKSTPEFAELAAFQAGSIDISARRSDSDREAKPLAGEFVSGNYFSTLGVGAFAGRTILPSDDQPSAEPVAQLSYRAWQQRYGADPRIVGSSFVLNSHPFTIVGIAPPGFFGETVKGGVKLDHCGRSKSRPVEHVEDLGFVGEEGVWSGGLRRLKGGAFRPERKTFSSPRRVQP